MPDSVYVAIAANRLNFVPTTVLFLRRSNGEWWLPGGRILPQHDTPTQAIAYWMEKLLPMEDVSAEETGLWHLSAAAGGHQVRLFEKNVEKPRLKPRYFSSDLSRGWGWFTHHGIHSKLYRDGTIPWGQAKMALYSLYNLQVGDERAQGGQLKDDLGNHGGYDWTRPA